MTAQSGEGKERWQALLEFGRPGERRRSTPLAARRRRRASGEALQRQAEAASGRLPEQIDAEISVAEGTRCEGCQGFARPLRFVSTLVQRGWRSGGHGGGSRLLCAGKGGGGCAPDESAGSSAKTIYTPWGGPKFGRFGFYSEAEWCRTWLMFNMRASCHRPVCSSVPDLLTRRSCVRCIQISMVGL